MRNTAALVLGLTAALAVVIAGLTLTPVSAPMPIPHADKVYHAMAFAGLTLPVAFFMTRWLPAAVILFALFGGLIEVIQPYVGRECSIRDWAADLAGIGLGVVIGRLAAICLTKVGRAPF